MSDTSEVARIREALAAGPTPGQWHTGGREDAIVYAQDGFAIANATVFHGRHPGQHTSNAELMAACNPDALAALLAHMDAQAADLARISAELGLPPTIGPAPGYLAGLIESVRDQAAEIERLRADAARLDWLADKDNHIGNVQLPSKFVMANLHSLRAAIDCAMKEQP